MTHIVYLQELLEKAGLITSLPNIIRATDHNISDPTPGYIYIELVNITHKSEVLSYALADFLLSRLEFGCEKKIFSRLKTLKTILRITIDGSNYFRERLRNNDEILRICENQGTTKNILHGSEIESQIRDTANEVRELLFSQSLLQLDKLDPKQTNTDRLPLPGMGGYLKTNKLSGFGNTLHSNDTMGDKIRYFVESTMTSLLSNGKDELLSRCFESNCGEYRAVTLKDFLSSPRDTINITSPVIPDKYHIPGRAGGCWDIESKEQYHDMTTVRDSSLNVSSENDDYLLKAQEILDEYCNSEPKKYPTSWDQSTNAFASVTEALGKENISHSLIHLLARQIEVLDKSKCLVGMFRMLLFVECYLRSSAFNPQLASKILKDLLARILSSGEKPLQISTKAEKIILIIEALSGPERKAAI